MFYSDVAALMSSSRSFLVYLNGIPCSVASCIISLSVISAVLAARHSVIFPSRYCCRACSFFHSWIALVRSFLIVVARSVFSFFSISFNALPISFGMRVDMISVMVFSTVYIYLFTIHINVYSQSRHVVSVCCVYVRLVLLCVFVLYCWKVMLKYVFCIYYLLRLTIEGIICGTT